MELSKQVKSLPQVNYNLLKYICKSVNTILPIVTFNWFYSRFGAILIFFKSCVCCCWFRFLDEVQSHSDDNKMSVQNLATVFGPNILRPRVEDPVTMMEGQ